MSEGWLTQISAIVLVSKALKRWELPGVPMRVRHDRAGQLTTGDAWPGSGRVCLPPLLALIGVRDVTLTRAGLRFRRRSSDDTLKAFHRACDAGDLQAADELLQQLEDRLKSPACPKETQRDAPQLLLKAQARLWSLRCRYFGDAEEALVLPKYARPFQQPTTSRVTDWFVAWLRGPRTPGAAETDLHIGM